MVGQQSRTTASSGTASRAARQEGVPVGLEQGWPARGSASITGPLASTAWLAGLTSLEKLEELGECIEFALCPALLAASLFSSK